MSIFYAGKMIRGGQVSSSEDLRMISRIVFCRDSGSSLRTQMAWAISKQEPSTGIDRFSHLLTMYGFLA